MKMVHSLNPGAVCVTLALAVALAPTTSPAQPPDNAYAKAIAEALRAIEQGRNDEARRVLTATSPAARGFEYDLHPGPTGARRGARRPRGGPDQVHREAGR